MGWALGLYSDKVYTCVRLDTSLRAVYSGAHRASSPQLGILHLSGKCCEIRHSTATKMQSSPPPHFELLISTAQPS